MSLTSHLNSLTSPVGQFIKERFSQTAIITKETNSKLRNSVTLLPAAHPWPYDKIGGAIDYRIRYSFDVTPGKQLAAWTGAHMLPFQLEDGGLVEGPYSLELVEAFFTRLDDIVENIRPVGRRLLVDEERTMARYCFILALFEEVYRSDRYKDGPLLVPYPKQSIDELLTIPEDAWIDDLSQLSFLFYDRCHDLLSRPFILNPTFSGSRDVGGADADLIVDRCLIEIKTSKLSKIDPGWLRQLAGYLLLDYNDEHHIQSLGIYMARQGLLFSWPLDEFLNILTGNIDVSLSQLRQDFRQLFLSKRVR
jgi:hypothetical protein